MLLNIGHLLRTLEARLPELEWKMTSLGEIISPNTLPRGLFRPSLNPTAAFYIADIKADIHALSKQDSLQTAQFLAARIRQKINVLTKLCKQKNTEKPIENNPHFGIQMISTHGQWVSTLEKEVMVLKEQQRAMEAAYQAFSDKNDTGALLQLKAELGALQKRLTLAQETWNRAVMGNKG